MSEKPRERFAMLTETMLLSPQVRALSNPAFRVLVNLHLFRNGQSGEAFPSQVRLAKMCGFYIDPKRHDSNTIRRGIAELQAAGLILVKPGEHRSQTYTIPDSLCGDPRTQCADTPHHMCGDTRTTDAATPHPSVRPPRTPECGHPAPLSAANNKRTAKEQTNNTDAEPSGGVVVDSVEEGEGEKRTLLAKAGLNGKAADNLLKFPIERIRECLPHAVKANHPAGFMRKALDEKYVLPALPPTQEDIKAKERERRRKEYLKAYGTMSDDERSSVEAKFGSYQESADRGACGISGFSPRAMAEWFIKRAKPTSKPTEFPPGGGISR